MHDIRDICTVHGAETRVMHDIKVSLYCVCEGVQPLNAIYETNKISGPNYCYDFLLHHSIKFYNN